MSPSSKLRSVRPRAVTPVLLGVLVLATLVTGLTTSSDLGPRTHAEQPRMVTAAAASTKPNIVTVMADDMRTDDLRFMPAVRRLLVGQGLSFRNSFSPYPLCCPARASFLTGRYAHNHHVLSHESPYGFKSFDDHATVATALQASGYQTGFVGKYLNGYGAQRSLVTGGPSFHYVPNGWTDWYGAVERPVGSTYRTGGTYNYTHTIFNVNGRIDDTHKGQYQTAVLGRFARSLVQRYHRSPRPFFLWLSAVAPHFGRPYEKGDPVHVKRGGGGFTRIATPARPKWVRGTLDRQIPRASGLPVDGGPSESDVSDKPRPMSSQPELSRQERYAERNLTRQRAEALVVLDREVARLVTKLKETGEYANTVFLFTSDNGYFLGEHRVRQGKIKPHEPSLRVPFVMAGRGIPHGERFDPVTTPGVTATIAELAGATSRMPYPADGRSVVPSIARDRGWSVPVVTEGLESGRIFLTLAALKAAGFHDARNTIGVRTPRYKYVRYSDGDSELYDLDHDPNELQSVVTDPAYASVRDELHQVWLAYKDCLGASCRAPMPQDLRRDPRQDEIGTNTQSSGVQRRYGYWR
ncbi:MAG: sulfatase [Nocardioidaceae bacterium]